MDLSWSNSQQEVYIYIVLFCKGCGQYNLGHVLQSRFFMKIFSLLVADFYNNKTWLVYRSSPCTLPILLKTGQVIIVLPIALFELYVKLFTSLILQSKLWYINMVCYRSNMYYQQQLTSSQLYNELLLSLSKRFFTISKNTFKQLEI